MPRPQEGYGLKRPGVAWSSSLGEAEAIPPVQQAQGILGIFQDGMKQYLLYNNVQHAGVSYLSSCTGQVLCGHSSQHYAIGLTQLMLHMRRRSMAVYQTTDQTMKPNRWHNIRC